MPTRNVVLTPHQNQLVDQLVTSGRYQNASEVLREGLRLIENRDMEYARRLEALREAVAVGVADFDAGNFQSFDTPAALRAHLAALTDEVLGQ
jgi:antitoxin ParD1/3/4